ncbi:MAG: peptidase domain-containing ABC transporter [Pseudomonadota bacterium]
MARSDGTRLLDFGRKSQLPVILQAETAECGLCCLAMIATFHGYEVDLTTLRQRFPVSSYGTSMKRLSDIAARLHLSTRALRVEPEQLDHLALPCILHWEMNHFVVLRAVKKNYIVIHDPATGERTVRRQDCIHLFSGVALELSPTAAFIRQDAKRTIALSDLFGRIAGLKATVTNIIILALLLQIFAVLAPFFVQTVVDDVVLRSDEDLLLTLSIGFGLLLAVEAATFAFREQVVLQLSSRLNMQMASKLFRHLVRLPMDYFQKRQIGDVISRFGALNNVRQIFTTGLISAVVDSLMVVVTLAVMFAYNSALTLLVLAFVAIYTLFRVAVYRPLKILTHESVVAAAKHDSHLIESIRAIESIKLFQMENDRQNQWQNLLVNALNKNIRIEQWNIRYNVVSKLLSGLENIIVVYVAASLVIDNAMTVGMLFAFISYKLRFTSSVNSLVTNVIAVRMIEVQLERIADIALTDAEDTGASGLQTSSPMLMPAGPDGRIRGGLEARSIGYRYGEDGIQIFKDLSFVVEPGETLAITGASGCGKTTLLRCLIGFLQPTSGEIRVDGRPIAGHPTYRSCISAVMQEDKLLTGSLRDNISCFEGDIDMKRIVRCAELAGIHKDIMRMPMQYDTLVGDMGSALSGGQKQRVLLARALYRRPVILFMDEATSHLDGTTETLVNDNLRTLGITRVLVSHRPGAVLASDRQICLSTDDPHSVRAMAQTA